MPPANYKALKEAFVSNLSGSSVWEVNNVTLVAPAAVFLWSVLQAKQRLFTPYTVPAFILDFLLNCCAILFATTLYSSAPLVLSALLTIPALIFYFTSPDSSKPSKNKSKIPTVPSAARNDELEPLPFKPFVTHYRGTMMVITCVAILAVDFRVFPRRFAKVETWGTSLMDMGVGSFVFAAGLVSVRPLIRAQQSKQATAPLLRRLRTSLRHALPLIVLGLIRLYSVKGLDYAEHVTEYGVHWNFFFTLGLLPPFVALFQSLFSLIPSYSLLSFLLATIYETALNLTDLKAYILTAPRTNLLSQNREGIFSLIGYLAIFLAGQDAGLYVLPREREAPAEESAPRNAKRAAPLLTPILRRLLLQTGSYTALYLFATSIYGPFRLPVSRRLANAPYVAWVAAFNTAQLFLFALVERLTFPTLYRSVDCHSSSSSSRNSRPTSTQEERHRCRHATSPLLHAFNRNGLAIFLLANLLTGLVNLTVRTLDTPNRTAVGILVAYLALLAAVAVALDRRADLSIKL